MKNWGGSGHGTSKEGGGPAVLPWKKKKDGGGAAHPPDIWVSRLAPRNWGVAVEIIGEGKDTRNLSPETPAGITHGNGGGTEGEKEKFYCQGNLRKGGGITTEDVPQTETKLFRARGGGDGPRSVETPLKGRKDKKNVGDTWERISPSENKTQRGGEDRPFLGTEWGEGLWVPGGVFD